jgi:hypothetical protein
MKQPNDFEKNNKTMLQNTKLVASDNFAHRVMHQIQQEKVLNSQKSSYSTMKASDTLFYFLISSSVIFCMGVIWFFKTGQNPLENSRFIAAILFVGFISSITWFLLIVDNFRLNKSSKKKKTPVN